MTAGHHRGAGGRSGLLAAAAPCASAAIVAGGHRRDAAAQHPVNHGSSSRGGCAPAHPSLAAADLRPADRRDRAGDGQHNRSRDPQPRPGSQAERGAQHVAHSHVTVGRGAEFHRRVNSPGRDASRAVAAGAWARPRCRRLATEPRASRPATRPGSSAGSTPPGALDGKPAHGWRNPQDPGSTLSRTCGKIGCCDSSPHRHASAHAASAPHPIARSAEPGEDWSWCYLDNVAFVVTRR